MAVLYTPHFIQFFDDAGDPLAGGKLYSYEAGTTTPKATYTTAAGSTPNANPVVLDSAGRATVFLDGSYKFILTDADDNTIEETDNVTAFSSGGVVDFSSLAAVEPAEDDYVLIGDTSDAGATKKALKSSIAVSPPHNNTLAPHRGLVIKYVSATTVDLDATEVTLYTSGGVAKKFATLNETLDITASGANGLDTGSEATSTWYHIWGIGKSDGTLDGVLSVSASAPTLPAGYTYYGYLGAVYNNGSGNFVTFVQSGNKVTQSNTLVVNAQTNASFTSVSLTAVVPPTATAVRVFAGADSSSGTNTVTIVVSGGGSGTTPTYGNDIFLQGSSVGASGVFGNGNAILSTAQSISYYTSGTNNRGYINVTGWEY